MAGHNKWSQIKHKKAKEDSKRGKAFTKIIKEITLAARMGGDPAGNPRLRALLEKARELNMPIDNAARAIKRGTGELPGIHYEEYTYEGYGPHGVAVMVETLSDNKNRTVGELRRIFSSNGGNLAETGAVSWMFEKVGVIRATGAITEDALLEHLMEFDIKDIRYDDHIFSIYCDLKSLELIKQKVKDLGMQVESAEPEWVAKNTIDLSEQDTEKTVTLLSTLQDHDDVQNVYANLV